MTTDFDAFAEEWDAFRRNPSPALSLFRPFVFARVLDAGCGNGRNTRVLAGNAKEVWALDASNEMLKNAKKNLDAQKNVHVLAGRLEALPFQDGFFDAVFCLAALHHLEPEKHGEAFAQLHRVLKKGGRLCLTVWNRKQKRFDEKPKKQKIPWRGKPRYYYFFDAQELEEGLRHAGFVNVELFYEKKGVKVTARDGQNLCAIAGKE